MKRFIIEREIEGACDLSADQLAEIARTSNDAAASLGVPYTWVTSYVAGIVDAEHLVAGDVTGHPGVRHAQ